MSANQKRRVKLTDIAEQTGFTVGTISKALKGRSGIARETRETIFKTAREIGYIANAQAGALRSGSTKTVAVIVGDIANPLFAIIIKLCVAALEAHGYRAIVMDTAEQNEREEQAVISALEKNVDGVLICPAQKSKRALEILAQNDTPFVLMGRHFDVGNYDSVCCNDDQGGYLAGKYLLELGHKRVLLITGGNEISSSRERLSGFRRAMAEGGVTLDPALCFTADVTAHDSMRIVSEALTRKLRFSAIFTFSDYLAWEVIYALGSNGIEVPRDVSVMGFDDVQSHLSFPPPLTTVHYPVISITRNAVDLLLTRIADPEGARRQLVFDAEPVLRATTAPPPAITIGERLAAGDGKP